MVFIKRLNYKTGINPSTLSRIDMNNLTGTQKLMLISSRIFGFNISGNVQSGNSVLRKALIGQKRLDRYSLPLWNVKEAVPFLKDERNPMRKKVMLERRKIRMLMRGIKLGKQQGGEKISLVNLFIEKGFIDGSVKKYL